MCHVNFKVKIGESIAIVGESGSGKSTLSRLILGMEKPSNGKVLFSGESLGDISQRKKRGLQKQMQVIFQNVEDSLNPCMNVGALIKEPLRKVPGTQRVEAVCQLVGLDLDILSRSPQSLSGGQKQRVAIARALTLNPSLLVCDEATSALDVSVQAQILNLIKSIMENHHMGLIFITHDLAVAQWISNRVLVFYEGRLIEEIPSELLTSHARHPYTLTLLSGEHVSDAKSMTGCIFAPKCARAKSICLNEVPPLISINENHRVLCHFI